MTIALDQLLEATPGTCGGRVRVIGTRLTVHRLAELYLAGHSADDIVREYPQLSLAQVYAAFAWYHSNRAEIDADLASDAAAFDAGARLQANPGT